MSITSLFSFLFDLKKKLGYATFQFGSCEQATLECSEYCISSVGYVAV